MKKTTTQGNNPKLQRLFAPVTGSASGFWRSPRGENHRLNSKPGDVWVNPGDIHDTDRLNWLEQQCVNVRAPLVHGSRDLFWASPEDLDGDSGPSDIRKQIDAAMMQNNYYQTPSSHNSKCD